MQDIAAVKSAGKLIATHLLLGVLLALGGAQEVIANIVGDDDRQELESFALSTDERDALYANTGQIECIDREGVNKGNGFIFDGGNRLLTSAHVVWKSDAQCTFAGKLSSAKLVLDLANAKMGIGNLERRDPSRDWAIVPLKTPIRTPVFKMGVAPAKAEELLLVSVTARGKQLDKSRLIGRRCTAVEQSDYSGSQRITITDCDTVSGDSGAPVFTRRNGVLEFVGIHEAGSPEFQNGRPFSIWGGSSTSNVSIDGKLGETLIGFVAGTSEALLKPFHDPNYTPLPPIISDLKDNPFFPRINRLVKLDPTPPRHELSIAGMKLRDLSPDDQLLYGIPDELKGVLVSAVNARAELAEGDVLLGETLDRISKLYDQGTTSLTVNVRKLSGRTERQALPLE